MNFLPNRNIFWAEVLLLPAKDSLTQESPSHHKLKKVNNMNLSRHWTTGNTAYNSERRKIKQVTPTIALTVCGSFQAAEKFPAVSLQEREPKKPSGQAELRIQRSQSREARDPKICQAKYWRGRNCTKEMGSRSLQRGLSKSG